MRARDQRILASQAEAMDVDEPCQPDVMAAAPALCPACGAFDFSWLGNLGVVAWFRCRRCGTDSHSEPRVMR